MDRYRWNIARMKRHFGNHPLRLYTYWHLPDQQSRSVLQIHPVIAGNADHRPPGGGSLTVSFSSHGLRERTGLSPCLVYVSAE